MGAQLALQWSGRGGAPATTAALCVRRAEPRDRSAVERLSAEAWAGATEAFSRRAEEIAQLFSKDGRLLLVAESEGRALGYLSAVQLGRALGIEEVGIPPEFRRMGIARALLGTALATETAAVLTVAEENRAARALYRSFGFRETSRRIVFERRP
jgi:ribosomal protein S18 acetylase RimI-like enzyme